MTKESGITGITLATILRNPLFLLSAMAAGCYVGFQYPHYSDLLRDIGDMYIAILQMCVMPFMVCAVAIAVGRLIRNRDADINFVKFISIVCTGLFVAAFLSIGLGVAGKPGSSLSTDDLNILGSIVNSSEHSANLVVNYENPGIQESQSASIIDFLTDLIPNNILASMGEGETLKVLFFALLIGLVLGFLATEQAEASFVFFNAIADAISRIINWCMYLLPAGLFCIVAGQVSSVGLDVLSVMVRFIVVIHAAGLAFLLICVIVVALKTRMSYWRVFSGLGNTTMIALGTRNSFISIPSAIDELQRNFNISSLSASLLAPVGFTVFRFGTVMLFGVTAVFMAQLYAIELNAMTLTVALLSSLLAGVATAGAPSLVALSMLSFVLDTLGLPFEIAFILLLAIDPIIDSIVTLVNVNANCAAIILASPGSTDTLESEDPADSYSDNAVGMEA